MALQLAPIFADQGGSHYSPRLKPATIARIDNARDILLSRLENPPSIVELAQLVGVSNSTLKRGFTELFGTGDAVVLLPLSRQERKIRKI
ncbi:MAG: hypothetical protein ACYTXA_21225 [Nostoc sp.]